MARNSQTSKSRSLTMVRRPALLFAGFAGMVIASCNTGHMPETEAPQAPEALQIAAWNIEHLAAEPGLGCEPRDQASYQLVADVIDQVDADVWLLQEIKSEQALARVFDPQEWTLHVENRPDTGSGPPWRGRDDGTRLRMQRTAVGVRAGISHERGPDLSALDVGGRGFLRHGVTVALEQHGLPLDLMSVHLKSGCFAGDGAETCPTLFEQAPVLEAWLDERSEDGRAVIVGGDFNRRLTRPDDSVWSDLDDGAPVDLVVAGDGSAPNCDPRYREFIDFLVLNEYAAGLKVAGSFAETTFEEGRRASDHCPISMTIELP